VLDPCQAGTFRSEGPQGERVFGKAPKNWKRHAGIEGSADGEAFLLYVERFLCRILKCSQRIMVVDNLQVHKMRRVRGMIEEKGCSVMFLPSYSPDFNPIEESL
jgi:transposase